MLTTLCYLVYLHLQINNPLLKGFSSFTLQQVTPYKTLLSHLVYIHCLQLIKVNLKNYMYSTLQKKLCELVAKCSRHFATPSSSRCYEPEVGSFVYCAGTALRHQATCTYARTYVEEDNAHSGRYHRSMLAVVRT